MVYDPPITLQGPKTMEAQLIMTQKVHTFKIPLSIPDSTNSHSCTHLPYSFFRRNLFPGNKQAGRRSHYLLIHLSSFYLHV